jgi:hypothetical protein
MVALTVIGLLALVWAGILGMSRFSDWATERWASDDYRDKAQARADKVRREAIRDTREWE